VELHLLNCALCELAYSDWDPTQRQETEEGAEAISDAAWKRIAESKKRKWAFYYISAAASVVVVLMAGWWWLSQPTAQEMDQVFSEMLEKSMTQDSLLGNANTPDEFAQAVPMKSKADNLSETPARMETEQTVSEDVQESFNSTLANGGVRQVPAAYPNVVVSSKTIQDESYREPRVDIMSDSERPVEQENVSLSKEEGYLDAVAADDASLNRVTESVTTVEAKGGKGVTPKITSSKKSTYAAAPTTESRTVTDSFVAPYPVAAMFFNGASPDFSSGMQAYRERKFLEASGLLRRAAAADANNLEAHLYAAVSFLNINQPQAALYHLDRVLDKSRGNLKEDAEWYKALAYLRLNEGRKATSLLQSIVKQNGKHAASARQALEELR
jgi:hypothetical protein